jgi:hypothetical protein
VIGVAYAGKSRAYRVADVKKAGGLIRDVVGGKPIVVLWYAPTRTAAVYTPDIDGTKAKGGESTRQVTLSPQKDGSFIDRETKSRWGIEGRAQAGPLKGRTLRWVNSVQCRWFAWAAEYPKTQIYSHQDKISSSPTGPKLAKTVIARLTKPIAIKFDRTPLQEAFAYIGEETGVTFIVDGAALKQSGYTKNMSQRFSLGTVPATNALHKILKQYDQMIIVITNEQEKTVTVMTKAVAAAKRLKPLKVGP